MTRTPLVTCLRSLPLGLALAATAATAQQATPAPEPIDSAAREHGALEGCARSLWDRASERCLSASSAPRLGLLHPYPGKDNLFEAPAAVAGGERNIAFASHGFVGAGYKNTVDFFATVGGGYYNTAEYLCTIGGGSLSRATGDVATIGGGYRNIATGTLTTIGGGALNLALLSYASVGGGRMNEASGLGARTGGGALNSATGDYATIAGGERNRAGGSYSFAAGRRARAAHRGAFVWGDSVDGDKPSSSDDEFNVYASGGARIFSNSAATTGVLLAPGGGSWSSVSDREAKENIELVDAEDVLARLASVPIATWNYRSQDDSVRHMGPMAQDFHAAFGLGLGGRTIDTVDPDGVALAAIQGLHARDARFERQLSERDAEIASLKRRVAQLEELEVELLALKERVRPLLAAAAAPQSDESSGR